MSTSVALILTAANSFSLKGNHLVIIERDNLVYQNKSNDDGDPELQMTWKMSCYFFTGEIRLSINRFTI